MKKKNKIIYWIATIWLALGMVSTGIVQMLQAKEEADLFQALGYPAYFMPLLGALKISGVVALLIPKFPILKEWAYAGFFFAMSGAIFSHIVMGSAVSHVGGPLLLLVLTAISWYFRPVGRKIILVTQ